MEPCETKESMRYRMRLMTLSLATAVLGTAIVWAGIVTRWTTEHEMAVTILFSASIPCLMASTVFSVIAVLRLRQAPGRGKDERRGGGAPR